MYLHMFDICCHKVLFSKEKIQYLALYCVHFPIYLLRALHLKYRFSSEGGKYSLKMVMTIGPSYQKLPICWEISINIKFITYTSTHIVVIEREKLQKKTTHKLYCEMLRYIHKNKSQWTYPWAIKVLRGQDGLNFI